MSEHLHHVHLFCSDIEATSAWYRDNLGAAVCFDGDFGGARNMFLRIGRGRLHLYDQPPRGMPGGAVHHVGIRTDDLVALAARLRANGAQVSAHLRDFGAWKYLMCMAPDNVLLELFQVNSAALPPGVGDFFRDDTEAPRGD